MSSRYRFSGFFRPRLGRITAGLIAVWLLWVLLAGDTSIIELWKLKRENADIRARIAELEKRLDIIDAEEQNLQDPEYLEKMAREQYGMIRDGERVYRIVNEGQ